MKKEAELFKVLGEETRLRLVTLLAIRGETCVCHLAGALDVPDFKISRHLGVLRSSGLVEARREGTWMHYRLARPKGKLASCLQACLENCLASNTQVKRDLKRLAKAQCAPAKRS
ncbi:MAG TPA: metalloregulator ArsR/SmtB family transcription factor [Planctomycetes bacterium]|nr:metalloregulator ArsR/SmtB family transcription factor [Planctomycetota bacterium]